MYLSNEKYLVILSKLIEFQVGNTPHSGRSLLEHLVGVFNLLKLWNNADYVCVAGLYHSIYGTKNFKVETVNFSNRDSIKSIIGKKSEELVYVYCACDHQSFFPSSKLEDKFVVKNLLEAKHILLSYQMFCDVTEIAVANLLEQLSYLYLKHSEIELINNIYNYWKLSLPYLSNPARKHFQLYFSSHNLQF